MAEQSMLWTTSGTGDGVGSGYASNRWQALIKKLFLSDQAATACVLAGVDNELAVSGTASPLSVATGAAIGHSFFYENDAPKSLTVTTPVVNITGGHIVLEANWAAQTVRALAVRNTDGVAAIPTLTQTAGTTWQVRLATFTITTGGVIALTDARKRAKYSGHIYANNFDSSAVDNSTIEIASGALRVKDLGITGAKLNSNTVDNVTLELASAQHRIKDLGVSTAKLANLAVTTGKIADSAVDDTKVGARVAQFYRRKGGDAANWSAPGTTNYTPTETRVQAGSAQWTGAAASSGSLNITFPNAYPSGGDPIVLPAAGDDAIVWLSAVSNTQATISWRVTSGTKTSVFFNWIAIGPET